MINKLLIGAFAVSMSIGAIQVANATVIFTESFEGGPDTGFITVNDGGAVGSFEKQRVLAMQDRLLQSPLADVVV